MRYFYFDPIKKQYYFPENYKEHTIFNNLYQPYTLKGWILWQLWNGISFIRELFEAKEIETFLPVENLTPYLPTHHLLAYTDDKPEFYQGRR